MTSLSWPTHLDKHAINVILCF